MRAAAAECNDIQRMQAWAGQSASLALAQPAAQLLPRLWKDARALLA
jgi:nitronate monooxygenase